MSIILQLKVIKICSVDKKIYFMQYGIAALLLLFCFGSGSGLVCSEKFLLCSNDLLCLSEKLDSFILLYTPHFV
jgi:hypothetical protein